MDSTARQLTEIRVGDDLEAWRRAGFETTDGEVIVGSTAIVPVGAGGARGIVSMAIAGIDTGSMDGLTVMGRTEPLPPPPAHPNGVGAWDHLVVMTPDADRTTQVFERTGLEPRRVRTFEMGGVTQRQTFFWLGDVILEMVGQHDGHGEGPATAWGVALTCADLDRSVATLGEWCGAAKDAVQPGRRIATVRTRELDISVPIALMSPHVEREQGQAG